MTGRGDLFLHLASGITTVCHCWLVTRKDGESYGFTDHDSDLSFEGHDFKAASGLSAGALQQTTGLSVDNSEAVGALSDASVSEEDLAEGRFDGADAQSWLVNWADPAQRVARPTGSGQQRDRGLRAIPAPEARSRRREAPAAHRPRPGLLPQRWPSPVVLSR